jgi:GNAT superfamily N-acetyltransferase
MIYRLLCEGEGVDRLVDFTKDCFDRSLKSGWSDEGVNSFYAFLDNVRIFPSFRFFEAFDEQNHKTLGVLATDNEMSHIMLLFVSPEHRKRGIGRSLIRFAENLTEQRGFTVNAEPTAVDFYIKNGFSKVREKPDEKDGIVTVRMYKKKEKAANK